jgi:hypothetical protein
MSFKYDSSGITDEFPVVPDGWYDFKIIDAEEMVSKNGNDMVLAKCQIINSPDHSDIIHHYVTFLPPDSKGAFINVLFRKAIGVPAGGDDIVDADDWKGKRFKGAVVTEVGKDGIKRNKIQKVSPLKDEAVAAAPAPGTVANNDNDIPF